MFTITVTARPAVHVVGMHVRTSMETAMRDCPKLWCEKFMPEVQNTPLCDGETYGISRLVDEETGVFDYWAAAPVAPVTPAVVDRLVISGMSRITLPEGLYAQVAIPALERLSEAYHYVFNEWPPKQSAYAARKDAPCYELYPAEYKHTGEFTLYFPVIAVG